MRIIYQKSEAPFLPLAHCQASPTKRVLVDSHGRDQYLGEAPVSKSSLGQVGSKQIIDAVQVIVGFIIDTLLMFEASQSRWNLLL